MDGHTHGQTYIPDIVEDIYGEDIYMERTYTRKGYISKRIYTEGHTYREIYTWTDIYTRYDRRYIWGRHTQRGYTNAEDIHTKNTYTERHIYED